MDTNILHSRPVRTRTAFHGGAALTLDLDAVADNVRQMRVATGVPVMAVVMADGFGFGAETVARAALVAGATWLGTATLLEAIDLRRSGLTGPVLAWLHGPDTDWSAAAALDIDVALSGAHQLAEAVQQTTDAAPLRVHLHVDVGLAREGASGEGWEELMVAAREAQRTGRIRVVGVMGHLPCADQPGHPSTAAGIDRFENAVREVHAHGLRPTVRHLAATAAALAEPAARYDLVRIGAGLHGIHPGLTPAARFTAPVAHLRPAAAGTGVGYGHEDHLPHDTVLAVLPIGYADGIPASLSPEAEVQVEGRRCRIVGRVSMDQTVVDVGPGGCSRGAVATVFGSGMRGEPRLQDWVRWSGRLEQDLLCGIGRRVERRTGGVR